MNKSLFASGTWCVIAGWFNLDIFLDLGKPESLLLGLGAVFFGIAAQMYSIIYPKGWGA